MVARPVTPRHATSTQFVPTISSNAPTRIYGSRIRSQSSEDLQPQVIRAPMGQLQRNFTSPDLRPVSGVTKRLSLSQTSPSRASSVDSYTAFRSPAHDTRSQGNFQDHPASTGNRGQDESQTTSTNSERDLGASAKRRNSTGPPFSPSSAMPHRYQGSVEPEEIMPVDSPTFASFQQPDPGAPALREHTDMTPNRRSPQSSGTLAQQNVDSGPTQRSAVPSATHKLAQSQTSSPTGLDVLPADSKKTAGGTLDSPEAANSDVYRRSVDPSSQTPLVTPRPQTPVPPNYTTEEKSKSLKDRLRRALSFSSARNLSDMADDGGQLPSGATARAGASNSKLYAQVNKSTDNMSISSTASSASMMLRKMGHGLSKKTKRSFNGIFSGSRSRSKQGVLEADPLDSDSVRPVVGSINYVNAESISPVETWNAPRSSSNTHSRAQDSISSLRSKSGSPAKATNEVTEATSNVDGHGSVSFPRLSEEISVDEDRARRVSTHLERPLPIDLAERTLPRTGDAQSVGRRTVSAPVTSGSPRELVHGAYSGKGILKRMPVPVVVVPKSPLARNASQAPMDDIQIVTGDFDISFEPAPSLELANFVPPRTPEQRPSTDEGLPAMATDDVGRGAQRLKFSPRITIHDTYTASEYDRRGEIATCNRLTPLLAQRIKEELNAYKMDEMSVAEESQSYTHFFT